MTAPRLSVILITKNEAHNIEDCLRSAQDLADEVVVVDSGSSDGTVKIARRLGAQVTVTSDWPGFGVQKGRALALARGDWVLSLDADERVGEAHGAAPADTTGQGFVAGAGGGDATLAGYELSRLSSFCGQWMRHGDWYPDRVLRLVRRDRARFTEDLVHERLLVDGPVGRLPGDLLHHTMTSLDDGPGQDEPLLHRPRSRSRAARQARQPGRRARARPVGLRAQLLVKRGFLDGRLGFVLAVYIAEGSYYRYLKKAFTPSAAPGR